MVTEMSLPTIHDQYALSVIAAVSILALFVGLFISQLWRPNCHKSVLLPPGSMGLLPLLGETLDFLGTQRANKPWEFFHSRVAKHGQLFKTHLIGHPTIVATGPAGNRLIFANENKLVQFSWPDGVMSVLGKHTMVAKTGEDFKRMRQALMTFLKPEALKRFVGRTESAAKKFIDRHWEGKDEVLVYPLMKHFAFSLACSLLVSRDDEEEQRRLQEPFNDFMKGILQLPINLPGTRFYKALRAGDILRRQFGLWIEQRRRDMEKGKVLADHDLLSCLLSFRDEEGQPLSEEEMRDNILLLLFAGHDTSAVTMTMMCKYLAENRDCYEEVWKEQEEIACGKAGGEGLNWEDIQRMKVSWRCMQETLRLQPPAQGGFRVALQDFEHEGYKIPKGWKMHWNVSGTHRDAKYFREPDKFRPERFAGNGPKPYTFVPFGGGQRMCPGNEFARMETLVLLHHLMRSRHEVQCCWELVDPAEAMTIDPMPRPTKGLRMRLLHQRRK